MTEIKIPKHLNIKIWKAALYIENAATKEEAGNRIEELLKEEGDEFMDVNWLKFQLCGSPFHSWFRKPSKMSLKRMKNHERCATFLRVMSN